MNELNDVADGAHDEEAHSDSLRDLPELPLVGLCASVQELSSILEEVARQVGKVLELGFGGHDECFIERLGFGVLKVGVGVYLDFQFLHRVVLLL